MEDDHVIVLSDHADAVLIDGSVRERTAGRLATHIKRDQPEIVLVDNMNAEYVAGRSHRLLRVRAARLLG